MASLEWNDLKISIGEINRKSSFDVIRELDSLALASASGTLLVEQLGELIALHSPFVIVQKDNPNVLAREIHRVYDDTPVEIINPLTRDVFNALPVSLTLQWVETALQANPWVKDLLKKSLTVLTRDLQLGNVQSNEMTLEQPKITTTGTTDTLNPQSDGSMIPLGGSSEWVGPIPSSIFSNSNPDTQDSGTTSPQNTGNEN